MTSEKALARLAQNSSDSNALTIFYLNNQKEINRAIATWFGSGTVVQEAVSRVLARIAKRAKGFHPQAQTIETFILDCADSECKCLYEEAHGRISSIQH
jgi:hypothetical protein